MIALLIAASDYIEDIVKVHLEPLGFDHVRYRQALKAMDNIDEINPDAILISAEDFPRHWKTLVQFVRNEHPRDKLSIVLLKGEHFAYEEAAKAAHIGVNGIVDETLSTEEERERLKGILGRHIPVMEQRHSSRFIPNVHDRIAFIFTQAKDGTIIFGNVESFSHSGLLFKPRNPSHCNDLVLESKLSHCSLRLGDNILSPICKLIRNGRMLAIEFISFLPGEQHILEQYLDERPLRERHFLENKKGA